MTDEPSLVPLTDSEAKAAQVLLSGFARALSVTHDPMQAGWCKCYHHITAHPMNQKDERPCRASSCECPEFEEGA